MRKINLLMVILYIICSFSTSYGEIPYNDSPDWESDEAGYNDYSTGGYLADFNNDGYPDLACGNGNDMAQNYNCIYYNQNGVLEDIASWRSDNNEYSGHIICGDFDKNEYIDLMVANYISKNGNLWVVTDDDLYFNYTGIPDTTPSWSSSSLDYSFSTTTIDYDGDGDLDIATTNGERYENHPGKVRIYENIDGVISTTPSWESEGVYYTYDLCAGDINNDGWLDLVCACDGEQNILFLNNNGSLNTQPDWQSTESRGSIRCVLGDINQDGFLDLAVADNEQLSSQDSKVRVYMNNSGTLENSASWVCDEMYKEYYSCVAFGDVDNDGDLDLCAGGWWEPLEVYENNSGTLETSPDWQWITTNVYHLVCEEIVLGDVDRDGESGITDYLSGDGVKHTYYLDKYPLKEINSITVDGYDIPFSDYCYSPVEGWISFNTPPPAGVNNIEVDYTYSSSLDLVVTNWHNTRGNFMFYNQILIPVKLTYFTAEYNRGEVELRWDIDGINEYDGFNLYRKKSFNTYFDYSLSNPEIKLNDQLIKGNNPFSFKYQENEYKTEYVYYLELVEDNNSTTIGKTRLHPGDIPISFKILRPYPNPFSNRITIPYQINFDSNKDMNITIYDISGRIIQTETITVEPGMSEYVWDTNESSDRYISDGIYIFNFEIDGISIPTKTVKIK